MACGKPVIATCCGGPESILAPEAGLLVPVDDPQALATAMEFMLNNYDGLNPRPFESTWNHISAVGPTPGASRNYSNLSKRINETSEDANKSVPAD